MAWGYARVRGPRRTQDTPRDDRREPLRSGAVIGRFRRAHPRKLGMDCRLRSTRLCPGRRPARHGRTRRRGWPEHGSEHHLPQRHAGCARGCPGATSDTHRKDGVHRHAPDLGARMKGTKVYGIELFGRGIPSVAAPMMASGRRICWRLSNGADRTAAAPRLRPLSASRRRTRHSPGWMITRTCGCIPAKQASRTPCEVHRIVRAVPAIVLPSRYMPGIPTTRK